MCNRHCRQRGETEHQKVLCDSIYESCHKVRRINHFVASSASFCSSSITYTGLMVRRAKIATNELAHQQAHA